MKSEIDDKLASEYIENWLELLCCKGTTSYPMRLLVKQHGDSTMGSIFSRLQCSACGKPPQKVTLTERAFNEAYAGDRPGWAIRIKG